MSVVVRAGTAAAADGAWLAWRAEGEGGRTLIASNGIGVSTFFWRRLSDRFARAGDRFVTWDYRGHGRSPPAADPVAMTVAGCARDLWTVADAVGAGRAVLLGHSMGAQVILEAYRQHPERVSALVPVLGAAGNVLDSLPGGALVVPLLRDLIPIAAASAPLAERILRTGLRLPGVWTLLRALGLVHPDLCPREELEPYFEHLADLDLRSYLALARDLLTHDARDLLPHIAVPVLVIAAERDLFAPVARSREMAKEIPRAELLVLRGATHAALVEQPELLALRLERFLSTVS